MRWRCVNWLRKAALNLVSIGKLSDVLQITKLFTIFEVYESNRDAVVSFGSPPIRCLCPICGGICHPAQINQSNWKPQECITCGASVDVIFQGSAASPTIVRSITMASYLSEDDYAELRFLSERVLKIGIAGRLDLFTFTPVKKAWLAIPKPRKMIISLVDTTDISAGVLKALLSLATTTATGDELLVSLDGLKREQLLIFPEEFRVAMRVKMDRINVGAEGLDFGM
jgi:hypothetical protein